MIRKTEILLAVAAVSAAGLGYLAIQLVQDSSDDRAITSFEACVDAGYPVRESYPEVCTTPDGKSFTRPVATPNNQPISKKAAMQLIDNCEAEGTYSLHNGDTGLILKGDRYQLVEGATEDELRRSQNPRCPFTKAAIE